MNLINTESIAIGYCNTCRKTVQGKLDTYSNTVYLENLPAGRVGDMVRADCGHLGMIMDGSNSIFIDGVFAATTASSINGIYVAKFNKGTDTIKEGE